MSQANIYQQLFEAYCKAYPEKKKETCQKELNKEWESIKSSSENKPFLIKPKAEEYLKKLNAIAAKKKGGLMQFFANSSISHLKTKTTIERPQELEFQPDSDQFCEPLLTDSETEQNICSKITSSAKRPAQEATKNEIDLLNGDFVGFYNRQKMDMLTIEEQEILKAKKRKLIECMKKLKNLQDRQQNQKKFRDNRREALNSAVVADPNLKSKLKIKDSGSAGRPRLEETQPLLLSEIVRIARHGSAAHEKRQDEIYRSILTLDDLTEQLTKDGFHGKRSSVYLRLQHKRSSSHQGKRHIDTVPVRLIRAQNDFHKSHPDQRLCQATIRTMDELASLLGPSEVCYISQDEKARVAIGITAANVQAPMLMHMQYRVKLPDHDWVVAAGHKLIPSVYAGIAVDRNGLEMPGAVGYSGPTYVAIRSGKHCSSTALSHCMDFERLLNLPEFNSITKSSDERVKPIVMFSVDGGPDENPRYNKVIEVAIHHFVSHDLDAIFIFTNAPGRSAHNRAERRMAPLSRPLSGLILPHNYYGNHLDAAGKTIDVDLEKQNFKKAWTTLAEVWSEVVFDGYPCVAEYVDPNYYEFSQDRLNVKDQYWFSEHVRTSQYFTQIVKCKNLMCCINEPRSSYLAVVPTRFIPPPIPLIQTDKGLKASDRSGFESHVFPSLFLSLHLSRDLLPNSTKEFLTLPYDLYTPSVQSQLLDRICQKCSLYFASKVMLKSHMIVHKKKTQSASTVVEKEFIVTRTRPVRIAAMRQREMMAIIVSDDNNGLEAEDAEWIDKDELDISGIPPFVEKPSILSCPVVTLEEHFDNPWENDE